MAGEVLLQNVEELHQPRGDVLRVGEVGRKGHLGGEVAQGRVSRIRPRVNAASGSMADTEETRSHGVQFVHVELVKVSFAVDEDVALERFFRGYVVADSVM